MALKRAISVDQLMRMKFKTMEFDGPFAESFGELLQMSGSWIVTGESGNGKTEFCIQLAKYLTKFGRVAYNSLEEGARLTFQIAIGRHNLTKLETRRFKILSEDLPDLSERLKKQKSPDIIFIDSLQFTGITKKEYREFVKKEFPNKLFIWISHAEGKKPMGSLAIHVDYNSDVKMLVHGFRVHMKTRYQGGGEDFIINKNLADKAWNNSL